MRFSVKPYKTLHFNKIYKCSKLQRMLSKKEIRMLIENAVFIPRAYEMNQKFFFFYNDHDLDKHYIEKTTDNEIADIDAVYDNVFCLKNESSDLELQKLVDEGIQDHFEMFSHEVRGEVINKVNLSLPYKQARINELENCFNKYVDELKNEVESEWEYSYLNEEDTISNIKDNFFRNLDKLLTFENGQPYFEFHYAYFESRMYSEKHFNSYTRRIRFLRSLKWIKEQILIEKEKDNTLLHQPLQSNFNLSLKVTDFKILNKFSGYFIKLFNINNDIQNKTKDEITAYFYECYKNLESNVNSLFEFSIALKEERTNFSLSIPGNEQREYFLRFYNGIINQRVKDIEEHIWEIIEFILGDTYQKNPNATVTREFYEKETEEVKFSLWYFNKEFLPPENIEPENESLPETIETNNQKLKWIGSPSQFGFIIDLLIQGGYLERPTLSFSKDANFYLQHFDINTTPGTLAIEVSENTNHLSTDNRKRIIIPHKDKLK